MRYVVFALALLPAAAAASEDDFAKQPLPAAPIEAAKPFKGAQQALGCENARVDYTVQRDKSVQVRTLGQEPRAAQYLGVMRIEDGCDKPVKISDRVGEKQR